MTTPLAPSRTNTSAFERLRNLPEVFTLNNFARLNNLTNKSATIYLSRMCATGLVDSLGLRTGVYFNNIANPNAKEDNLLRGVQAVFPSAILRGESVLHAAGWTTQIPSRLSVGILERRSYPTIDEVALSPRKKSWFVLMKNYMVEPHKAGFSTYGLIALKPEAALVDLCLSKDDWMPDPDDLELSDKEWLRTYKAFKELGVAIPEKYAQEINSAISHRVTKKVSRLNSASPANTVEIDDEQHNDMHR